MGSLEPDSVKLTVSNLEVVVGIALRLVLP
jgi:hypothetical protein